MIAARVLPAVGILIAASLPARGADPASGGKPFPKDAAKTELRIRVLLDGTPPKSTERIAVGENGSIADVIVYCERLPEDWRFPVPEAPVLVKAKNRQFVPAVIVVRAGQVLRVENEDTEAHTAHMTNGPEVGVSPATAYDKVHLLKQRLSTAEALLIRCDVHPQMYVWGRVCDNPYFCITDAEGRGRFPLKLPPGKYLLAASHRILGEVQQEVVVTGAAEQSVEFRLKYEPKRKPSPQDPR